MNITNIETFYQSTPQLDHNRNRFPFKKTVNYNMKMGEITPVCIIRTEPGTTYKLDMATVIKVAPLVAPPQDDALWKTFAFKFTDRIEWDNYKYWYGEKRHPEDPENEETYLFPKITLPKGGFAYNSFYDNIGCPPEKGGYKIDKTIPNGDRDIYNNYFRNQALENPLPIDRSDADGDPMENMELRKICKPRDLFTSMLPTATGGNVEIPLGSECPVIGNGLGLGLTDGTGTFGIIRSTDGTYGRINTVSNDPAQAVGTTANATNGLSNVLYGVTTNATKSGLIADLTKATGAPLEGLYQAIAYNTYNYLTSRSGNRYFEQLAQIYGITNPEGVMQIPEFLGSLSQYIDFDTVTQTSSTEGQATPLANRAANGYMENYGSLIETSCGEFGWIIIYAVVTHYPKYQQGVSKLMQTEDVLDLFNPIFNLIGDEPIYQSEIYVEDDDIVGEDGIPVNEKVIGYQKRHSRYIMPLDEIHGEQRSSYPQSLDTNHFGEYYTEAPTLNKTFDKVNDNSFKRALQITDETQFICNSMITGIKDIEIPTQSVPSPYPDIKIA